MGWSLGFDEHWNRDVGYEVPAKCDHPDCDEKIDRGISYICGGQVYGGEHGCGLFFCDSHLYYRQAAVRLVQVCERCDTGQEPFGPSDDLAEWLECKEKGE